MTETTAQDRVDEENLVDAAARAAAEAGAKSLATVRPEQQRFDDNQLAILRQLGIEDASQGDLDLFFHYCRTTGLDPFRKQIYMIGRRTKIKEWNPETRQQDEKWVMKYTIQTGIDGYRRNGREAAKKLNDTLTFEGPFWCGEDGEWKEVWPAKTPPTAAKYTVFRNGDPFTAVVHYDEFVQTNAVWEGSGQSKRIVGQEPNSMWAKMPRNQTAKCAEAMAYRRAYPDDFAGLILEDAAQPTVIDQDGNIEQQGTPEPKRRPGGGGIGAVRAERERREREAAAKNANVVDGEVINEEPAAPAEPESEAAEADPRQKFLNAMFGLLSKGEAKSREDQLAVIAQLGGLDELPEHRDDITDEQLRTIVRTLDVMQQAAERDPDAKPFPAQLTDVINKWVKGQTEAGK